MSQSPVGASVRLQFFQQKLRKNEALKASVFSRSNTNRLPSYVPSSVLHVVAVAGVCSCMRVDRAKISQTRETASASCGKTCFPIFPRSLLRFRCDGRVITQGDTP